MSQNHTLTTGEQKHWVLFGFVKTKSCTGVRTRRTINVKCAYYVRPHLGYLGPSWTPCVHARTCLRVFACLCMCVCVYVCVCAKLARVKQSSPPKAPHCPAETGWTWHFRIEIESFLGSTATAFQVLENPPGLRFMRFPDRTYVLARSIVVVWQ